MSLCSEWFHLTHAHLVNFFCWFSGSQLWCYNPLTCCGRCWQVIIINIGQNTKVCHQFIFKNKRADARCLPQWWYSLSCCNPMCSLGWESCSWQTKDHVLPTPVLTSYGHRVCQALNVIYYLSWWKKQLRTIILCSTVIFLKVLCTLNFLLPDSLNVFCFSISNKGISCNIILAGCWLLNLKIDNLGTCLFSSFRDTRQPFHSYDFTEF